MKSLLSAGLLFLTAAASPGFTVPPPWADWKVTRGVAIEGPPELHTVSWPSRSNYFYWVQRSFDLETWLDTSCYVAGDGEREEYEFQTTPVSAETFYRVLEIADPNNGGFLALPESHAEVQMGDGVRFAFDLNLKDAGGNDVFAELPAKIRIWQTPVDGSGNEEWTLIGALTGSTEDEYQVDDDANHPLLDIRNDFAEREGTGFKFLRGSAVWLPESAGLYLVRADALAADGTVLAEAERSVVVTGKSPVVEIEKIVVWNDGQGVYESFPSPYTSQEHVKAAFETSVSPAPGGKPVWRVEFYADTSGNGDGVPALLGYDYTAPYGDGIQDVEGNSYMLMRGNHRITAKAVDTGGATSGGAEAFEVNIQGGNARPELVLDSPAENSIVEVDAGETVTIVCTPSDPDDPNGPGAKLEKIEAYDVANAFDSDELNVEGHSGEAQTLSLDTTGWQPGIHTVAARAWDKDAESGASVSSHPRYFKVRVRVPGSGNLFARNLVEEIIDGDSVAIPDISNVSFTGAKASSAIFPADPQNDPAGTEVGLQIDGGILLTTGEFALWNAGNKDPDTTGYNRPATDGDEEIERWLGIDPTDPDSRSSDAAVLEFDVFCANGQLELEFQFGSEEYLEYVDNFNDTFLVTIDGVPVSVTPDASGIVSVNTAHPPIPADTLVFGTEDLPAASEFIYLNNRVELSPNETNEIKPLVNDALEEQMVEYDGMTVRLGIHAFVTPGISHHVRISIADLTDNLWDSGLFIGKESLRAIEPQP